MMKCSCFQAKRSLLSTLYCQTSETKKKSSLPKKKTICWIPIPQLGPEYKGWSNSKSSLENASQNIQNCWIYSVFASIVSSVISDTSPLIISFVVILLPLLEPLFCLDFVFDFFRYISNPTKTSLAINLVMFFTLPGVVLVIGRHGTFGIDIYRLAIL